MKKKRNFIYVFIIALFIGNLSFNHSINNVNSVSKCQEVAQTYTEKHQGEHEISAIAESGDVCAFSIVTTLNFNLSQKFYVVKKDGTEVKKQEFLYQDNDKSHFPKIDSILVRESGDFYAVSYKEYHPTITEYTPGLGYIVKISKITGEILWTNQSQLDKKTKMYNFSKVISIIEKENMILLGNTIKTDETKKADEKTNIVFPQVTVIKKSELVNNSLFLEYENYEAINLEQITDARYVLTIQSVKNKEDKKEIILNEKYEEQKGETKLSVEKQKESLKTKTNQTVESKKTENSNSQASENQIILVTLLLVVAITGGIIIYYWLKRKNKK
ncbi:MAG: hypothetical protein ACRCV7_01440 [Culicoidibacterales bacterium]